MIRHLLFYLVSWCLASLVAVADTQSDYYRIARISYIAGHVSFQHAGDVEWSAASINFPLQPGDRIYTSTDGRVEIEFDDGSVYRLAEKTDVEILSMRDNIIQLRVLVGLSTLNLTSGVDFEVDTPAAAFSTLRKGVYRFNVYENGDSDAVVRKGLLEAANNQFSRRVESGQLIRVSYGERSIVELSQYNRRDEWDEWNDRRDADLYAYASRNYLPSHTHVGVASLDRYGRWVSVASYGYAWVPLHIDAYWSPYRVGRWCHRPRWGWTWISYEPWGWLPYHYGRWHFSVGIGWCWIPGPSFTFNFWSPGLVRFYHGPGWVSWCPLGPGDYYNVNNYYYNNNYHYQINQLQVLQTRRPENLLNRNAPGAFHTANVQQFRNESFSTSSRSLAGVDQPWQRGALVRERLAIEPTSQSLNPNPDRAAVRPAATTRLPAVIRTEPDVQSGSEGRYARITNPDIPAVSSVRSQRNSEPGSVRTQGSGNLAVGRANQTQPERPAAKSGSPVYTRILPEDSDGRRMSTSRASELPDNPGNTGNTPGNRERTTVGSRPEASASPRPQSTSPSAVPRYERVTPEPRSAPESSRPQVSPSPRESQRSYSYSPPSGVGAYQSPSNTGSRNAIDTGRARTYSSPRQVTPSPNTQPNTGSRILGAPSSSQRSNSGTLSPRGSSGGSSNSGTLSPRGSSNRSSNSGSGNNMRSAPQRATSSSPANSGRRQR